LPRGACVKAVDYGEMAAKRATNVYAFGEAVRLLEQALKVQKVLDPDDKKGICDILLALGDALRVGGEPQRAFNVELQEAFSLAEDIGDVERASRACHLALTSLIYHGAGSLSSWVTPEAVQWVERADRCAEPDTVARVWANIGMGEMKAVTGLVTPKFDMLNEGSQLLVRNLEMARRLDDPDALWHACASRLLHVATPQHFRESLRLAKELAEKPRTGVSIVTYGLSLLIIIHVILETGQRTHAEKYFNEIREIAERSEQANLLMSSMLIEGVLNALDGRLEDAVKIGQRMGIRGEELGITEFSKLYEMLVNYTPLLYLGRIDELLTEWNEYVKGQIGVTATILAHAGRDAEVTEILEKWVIARPGFGTAQDMFRSMWDTVFLEAAVTIGHRKAAELLLNRLAGSGLVTNGILQPTCIPRHLGGAAVLLERYDEARQYYQEAIKVCTEMPFRPELALTRLQLAELLLEHYPDEKKEALEHLDFAINEFREMKMQPSLERALRHKDILKA